MNGFEDVRDHGAVGDGKTDDTEAFRKAAAASVQTQNDRGEWVPAIPLPYFLSFGRCRCDCGEVRREQKSYREHYALTHILGMS